jgi:uncharacterized membrane protein
MPDADRPRSGAERARVAVLLLLALLATNVLLALRREADGGLAWLLLAAFLLVPLLAPLPGLWRRTRRTYAWATLCLTPHFVYALTELVANPALRALAAAMLVLSLAVMVGLVAYLRLTRPVATGH